MEELFAKRLVALTVIAILVLSVLFALVQSV